MNAQPREIWDADNHLYEPPDAYTRHLPKKYLSAVNPEYRSPRERTNPELLSAVRGGR